MHTLRYMKADAGLQKRMQSCITLDIQAFVNQNQQLSLLWENSPFFPHSPRQLTCTTKFEGERIVHYFLNLSKA